MMRKKLIIYTFLIFLFFLTACSKKTEVLDSSWEAEVLYASECGYDGLQCCVDAETPCLYEQSCCVDPNNPSSTYCASECAYGERDTFCRDTEPKCDENMVCYNGFCKEAGHKNQPCLSEGTCDDGLVCNGSLCVLCGISGNPCCQDNTGVKCFDEGVLDNTRTSCINNYCRDCGYSQLLTCPDDPACNEGHLKNNNICLSCGNFNQPCCQESVSGYQCKGNNLTCANGFCSIFIQ